ncbi:MAG: hypothetical protein UW25_C0011G0014 [Candidatus Nomurabacteria bacterium GW2011_GWB1_44_12]|uniref:Uncharacterized protein n=1 Tax=Candidatus Nomurabacteria bacterium GW2011_GWB1_44_12 TaxID=1618748 RepID=A0A837I6U5_9BACT|nr:MAG: hypothetical protein UW25_C0011G0014 [Candidatus Nomurabacteria bacterium GW2011_GWB1_44_12]
MNLQMKKYLSPVNSQGSNVKGSHGFTLLELLIVVSIIAILSVALVLVLDPAETLRKSRDAQRMSDLSTLKTAIGLYTTSTTTPYLGSNTANTLCKPIPSTGRGSAGAYKIWYSIPTSSAIGDLTLDSSDTTTPAAQSSASLYTLTDSTGWIPVNFDSLIGGSPISNLPIDPVNTIGALGGLDISTTTLAYRYSCSITPLAFEIDAVLESNTYTTGTDNKFTKDGGNSDYYYEVGTNLKILGAGGASPAGF